MGQIEMQTEIFRKVCQNGFAVQSVLKLQLCRFDLQIRTQDGAKCAPAGNKMLLISFKTKALGTFVLIRGKCVCIRGEAFGETSSAAAQR